MGSGRGRVDEVVGDPIEGDARQGQPLPMAQPAQGGIAPLEYREPAGTPSFGDEDLVAPTGGMTGFLATAVAGLRAATGQLPEVLGPHVGAEALGPPGGPDSYGSTGTFATVVSGYGATQATLERSNLQPTPLFRQEEINYLNRLQQQAPHLYPGQGGAGSAPSSEGSGAPIPQQLVQAEVRRQLSEVVARQNTEADALRAQLRVLQSRNRALVQSQSAPDPGYSSSGWLQGIAGWFNGVRGFNPFPRTSQLLRWWMARHASYTGCCRRNAGQ